MITPLFLLRQARLRFGVAPSYNTAVDLQRAKRSFENWKRENIRRVV